MGQVLAIRRKKLVTLADLLEQLGDIAPDRVWLDPPVGKATEKDVIRIHDRENRLCELINGTLVEKAMGARESLFASLLIQILWNFVEVHDLGVVLGADGTLRILPRQVRIPDVSFISWARLPSRGLPDEPIPDLVPDLAVEVISEANMKKEMERKLREYFTAGVRLVWLIYPKTRTVEVYTSATECRRVRHDQTLDGGDVLPGFELPLRKLFARANGRRQAKK